MNWGPGSAGRGQVNWIAGEPPAGSFRAEVKTRYTAKETWATVFPEEGGMTARVEFDELIRDITPGQAAVFYDGEVLVGGGEITDLIRVVVLRYNFIVE